MLVGRKWLVLDQPQVEGVDVGACVERAGVGGNVVVGTRSVVVGGGVDVGDRMESVAVGYMEVVGDGFTVAVEGIAGACVSHCGTREDVVVSVGQKGDGEGVGDGSFVRCDRHRYGTEGGGWWRVGRRRRTSEARVSRTDVGVVVDVVGVGATTAVEGVGTMACARSARRHQWEWGCWVWVRRHCQRGRRSLHGVFWRSWLMAWGRSLLSEGKTSGD